MQVLKGELAVDVIVGPDGLWPPAQIPSNLTLADSDSSTEEVRLLYSPCDFLVSVNLGGKTSLTYGDVTC